MNSCCCVVQLLLYCCAVGCYCCGAVAALENQKKLRLRTLLQGIHEISESTIIAPLVFVTYVSRAVGEKSSPYSLELNTVVVAVLCHT